MPNWCHNTLTVAGEPGDLLDFVARVRVDPHMVENGQRGIVERALEYIDQIDPQYRQKRRFDLRAQLAQMPEQIEDPGTPLSFEQVVPTPEAELEGEGWYGWRIEHWGTKWDANFTGPFMAMGADSADIDASVEAKGMDIPEGTDRVAYKFDTAWSPPVPWVALASVEHPGLTFTLRFAEAGNGYAGEVEIKAGEVEREDELNVEDVLEPEEMWF